MSLFGDVVRVVGSSRDELRAGQPRSVLTVRDRGNGCERVRIEDGAGIAVEAAKVSAAETAEVSVGGAIRACTAPQGIAVVKLDADESRCHAIPRDPEQRRRSFGRVAVRRASADARFDSLEVLA